MMKNDPAFPIYDDSGEYGLTKLEYFVAEAMHGLIANPMVDVNKVSVSSAAIIGEAACMLAGGAMNALAELEMPDDK